MVVRKAALARALTGVALVSFAAQPASGAETSWTLAAGCRDGLAQGPYELRSDGGQLRVAGAFNEGTRTGSFIFWRANGVREAHVPYDGGRRNGTVATWYDGPVGAEPPRHFESGWRDGQRDGQTRSWYADGRRRSQTEYRAGALVGTVGWTESGAPLSDAAARALAAHDQGAADAAYARLDALIRDHMPRCQ